MKTQIDYKKNPRVLGIGTGMCNAKQNFKQVPKKLIHQKKQLREEIPTDISEGGEVRNFS